MQYLNEKSNALTRTAQRKPLPDHAGLLCCQQLAEPSRRVQEPEYQTVIRNQEEYLKSTRIF